MLRIGKTHGIRLRMRPPTNARPSAAHTVSDCPGLGGVAAATAPLTGTASSIAVSPATRTPDSSAAGSVA
ncbi:MAG: hypothetical protein CMM84_12320 [Rhodothermaceae bacterium]|nr:hypothetical protein [Rhodothermaceae bacterium]